MSGNLEFNSNNFINQENPLTNSVRATNSSKIFEVSLTLEQFKQIQKFMPPGYSFAQAKSNKPFGKKVSNNNNFKEDINLSNSATQKERRDAFSKAEQNIKEPVEFMKRCEYVLSALKKHKHAFPFLEPVDPEILGIPDYFDVIKEPMDLFKVEKRLKNGFYKQMSDFENDIRKIWNNALTYNKPITQIFIMTVEIKDYFETLVNEDEVGTKFVANSKPKILKVKKIGDVESMEPVYRPSKPSQIQKQVNQKPLTYQEKKVLSDLIRQLPSESLWEVWKIVSPDNQNQEQEIEFDIDTLSPAISRQLEEFVKSKLKTLSNKKSKVKTNQVFRENINVQTLNEKSKDVQNPIISSGTQQPNNTQQKIAAQTSAQKEVHIQKDETDSDSFLGNLSESDD